MTNFATISLDKRAQELYLEHLQKVQVRTDKLFAPLLLLQWVACIIIVLVVSPLAWEGMTSYLHPHVWFAVILGAVITLPAIYLIYVSPGKLATRIVVAISQMTFSTLLIHLTGGRIETHFHIFGSLAFLAFYRDSRVIVVATAVAVFDHLLRGLLIPESIYGVLTASPWRTVEHGAWVVFEDMVLIMGGKKARQEMQEIAIQRAQNEEIQANVQELAERRAELLQSTEHKLSTVLDSVLEGFIMTNSRNMVTAWNKQAENIFGWKPDEAIGANLTKLLSLKTQNGEEVLEITSLVLDNGNSFSRIRPELSALRKNGQALPIEITLTPHKSANDLIYSVFVRDITKKREFEQGAEKLAAIVNTSTDAIIGRELDGTITSWNPGAERMFGFSKDEAVSQNISIIIPEEKHEEMDGFTKTISDGNSVIDAETIRTKKDGSKLDVSISLTPLRNQIGTITGASIIARDITNRKEVERRISEFYSTVSHELRTPLTSIRGALTLVADEIVEPGSEEAREMVQIARNSSERLVNIINDILDLRKIEAGKLELNFETVSGRSLISSAIQIMTGMAQKANVQLSNLMENDISLYADSSRLLQVLTNLISNAIKYSEPNKLVTLTAEATASCMVRFSVTDEGPGIPLEFQHKLFEKFQQVDSSDTRAKEGSGLGLSICKAIVLEHGGKIGLQSKPGVGTTFWFELPFTECISKVEDITILDGKKLVLMVEKDFNLAHLLSLKLNEKGFRTRHVASKAQAINVLGKCQPDVILMALLLPDGSGIDLIENIRSDARTNKVPIIVMTGRNINDFECAPPVVFDWFSKPLDLTSIITSIERATSDLHDRKILVVEHDLNIRAVIVALLKTLNATCIEAGTGIQALSIVKSSHPDVIVLDVNVPEYNGFKFVELLRKDSSSLIPLIVYSGEEFTEADRKRLTLGVTKHLTKGRVTPNEFVEAVRELLDSPTASSFQTELNSNRTGAITSN